MNVSRFIFATAALASLVSVAGCRVDVETKTRYTEPNVAATPAAWGGGAINIDIKGVGLAQGTSGVTVTADPSATQVTATARMLGFAFEKADADQSIIDAKATFKITANGTGVDVSCGHGGSHGSSNSGESGCELVEIVVPAGTDTQKLQIKILSGNGGIRANLQNAVLNEATGNSSNGDIDLTLPGTVGGKVSFVNGGGFSDINAKLPANFTADSVVLNVDDPLPNEVHVDKGPFSDIVDGGGRGAAGTGLASLGFRVDSGKITLSSY